MSASSRGSPHTHARALHTGMRSDGAGPNQELSRQFPFLLFRKQYPKLSVKNLFNGKLLEKANILTR